MIDRLAGWVETCPRRILAAFALATAVLSFPALRVEIAPGLDYLLVEKDPDRERNVEIKSQFSNDEIVVVGLDVGPPDHLLDLDDLRQVEALTRSIEGIEGVEEVWSLASVEDVTGDGEALDSSNLVDPSWLSEKLMPEERASIEHRLRERVEGHRLYEGNLIAADGSALAIVIEPALLEGRPSGEINQRLVHELHRVLENFDWAEPWSWWIGGYPAAEVDSNRIILRDLAVLTGAALVLILLLAALLLRRLLPVLGVIVLAGWSELVAIAWLGVRDLPVTAVTATLPAIVLATSSAYALYLFSFLRQADTTDRPGPLLVHRTARPLFVSAVSTSAGFLSLGLMPIAGVRHLGTSLAIGIVGSLLGALLLLPSLVQLTLRETSPQPSSGTGPIRATRGLWTVGVRWARRPWSVIAIATATTLVLLTGVSRMEIESDPITYWQEDSYHRRSDVFLHDHFDGSLFVNLVLTTNEPEGALTPEILDYARRLIDEARATGVVTRSLSLLDYLVLLDEAIAPETQGLALERRTFLSDPGIAAQYMLLYESSGDPEDFENYVDFDRSSLNAFLKVGTRSSSRILALRQHLLDLAAGDSGFEKPEGVRTEVLGTWLLFPKAMDGITRYMVRGLAVAIGAILIIMTLALRSWRLGLISIIPNALPILACLGVLGWLGIPLSFVTSITGCLAVGLAVDDTAHVFGHLSRRPREGPSLFQVYSAVGPALTLTTICLGAGFLAITLSEFRPLAHLGYATAITLGVALLCDLLVLPSLLAVLGYEIGGPEPASVSS